MTALLLLLIAASLELTAQTRIASDFELKQMQRQVERSKDFISQVSGRLNLGDVRVARNEKSLARAEYRKVHDGLRKARVHRIFDSAGTRSWLEGRYEIRNYTPCPDRQFGYVTVNYKDGRVDAKRAYWG